MFSICWNDYTSSIKYLTPFLLLHFYKSEIRPEMEYCCWSCTILTFLPWWSSKTFTRPCGWWFVFHRCNITSLLLLDCYFYVKCSNMRFSLIFHKICLATPPDYLCISLIRRAFHSESYPRTPTLWNASTWMHSRTLHT